MVSNMWLQPLWTTILALGGVVQKGISILYYDIYINKYIKYIYLFPDDFPRFSPKKKSWVNNNPRPWFSPRPRCCGPQSPGHPRWWPSHLHVGPRRSRARRGGKLGWRSLEFPLPRQGVHGALILMIYEILEIFRKPMKTITIINIDAISWYNDIMIHIHLQ
jgi:hypothetical protein